MRILFKSEDPTLIFFLLFCAFKNPFAFLLLTFALNLPSAVSRLTFHGDYYGKN